MPKRTDIESILLIGSGPIVIGQACEFDYSGTQACKALRREGYRVILVNSNPATIMTDPEFADATYIEPITPEAVEKIIAKEKPDALLPTLGGQTALNTAMILADTGVLDAYSVEMIGASREIINKAEDRNEFKKAMERINIAVPKSGLATNFTEAQRILEYVGLPCIIRPAFTLGGTGGSFVHTMAAFREQVEWGLSNSPIDQILIEQSALGWKEYELEVMRDFKDNVVIVCSIENFDPMGIHTGDSITIAPAQTLTDKEYQVLRNMSIAIMREIGVQTGGSNIQFAVNPKDGAVIAIEMNPRVSRSSALASKATGFPIAKIAAKLAVGYTLDEIPNDITQKTPACFEPSIDYVVTKIPRWTFEKFPRADDELTTQMKSVGEVMSIGRTFKESLQKALRSLEIGRHGLGFDAAQEKLTAPLKALNHDEHDTQLSTFLSVPKAERIFYILYALQSGWSIERIHSLTAIDPWFLRHLEQIAALGKLLSLAAEKPLKKCSSELLYDVKRSGFSDEQIAFIFNTTAQKVREFRHSLNIHPVYKLVDTCAGEFEAYTPYYYSTYEEENEAHPGEKERIIILGSGPNRIGQGIEFDYCCTHASFALRDDGYEAIMVNCNPETVSTDYDTSDKLFFEPLTTEDVLEIIHAMQPKGVIVQFGGQTPLKLSQPLNKLGIPILGTSPDAIDEAENRERFAALVNRLAIKQPPNGIAYSINEAKTIAEKITYPVLLRPSYVLGGRAMRIIYDQDELIEYMTEAVEVSDKHPVLIDKFLDHAIEVDVDAVSDGEDVFIGGIMEHIEAAGVHSGDSACVTPPRSLGPFITSKLEHQTKQLARALKVIGLINIQFAVKDGEIYVLEVNPRASRTIPYISKSIGVPLAKVATHVTMGKKLSECHITPNNRDYYCVKEVVLPFVKFRNSNTTLGPEMKSTGEVMGIAPTFGIAYAKAQIAAGSTLPLSGTVFCSVADSDKEIIADAMKTIHEIGFTIVATKGTNAFLNALHIPSTQINKLREGPPTILNALEENKINLIFNTVTGKNPFHDAHAIRQIAVFNNIPYVTTVEGIKAAVLGIQALIEIGYSVQPLQEYYT